MVGGEVKESYGLSGEVRGVDQRKGVVVRAKTSIEETLLVDKHMPAKASGQLNTILFTPKWYHSLWYMKIRKPLNKFLAIIMATGSIILLIA